MRNAVDVEVKTFECINLHEQLKILETVSNWNQLEPA